MPIVGIYTKDFPPIGRALLDTDIIVVAIAGDVVTYKSTVAALATKLSAPIYFTDSGTTGIAVNLSTGVITVTMASFPTIAANGIIRGSFDVRVGSDWVAVDAMPEVTKTAGVITTAVFYLNQSFDEIRGRIF